MWEYESTDPEFGIRDRFLRWLRTGRNNLRLNSLMLTGYHTPEVNQFLSACSDTIHTLMIDTLEEGEGMYSFSWISY